MIYNTEELLKKYKNFHGINKAIKSKRIRRISHGLYSDKDSCVGDLENLFARYPNAILTMESAFSYYGLTDYIPDKYYVATKQNAHRIEQHNVSQLFISNNIFDVGEQTIKTKYGFINIYDKERLLIELFRLKTKIDYSLFKEIVKSYRLLVDNNELDEYKIVKYCSLFKNGINIRQKIQEAVL